MLEEKEEEGSLGTPYKIINGKKIYAKKRYLKSKFSSMGAVYEWVYPDLEEEGEKS